MKLVPEKSTLILFTSNYPFGTGEVFLDKEVIILSQQFDSIIIVSSDTTSTDQRSVPENVEVMRRSFSLNKIDKLRSLFSVFTSEFRTEYQLLKKRNSNFLKHQIRYLLSSLVKGKKIRNFISSLVREKELDFKNLYLYSYWWLDESIGIALYKKENPIVKAFSRCHGYDVYAERSSHNYLPLRGMTIEHLDRVFSISKDAKRYVLKNYLESKSHEEKIVVSRLGVGNGFLKLKTKNREEDSFTIVSCSSIYPNKRVDLIARAVRDSNLNLRWIHIGSYIKDFSEDYYKGIREEIDLNQKGNLKIEFLGNRDNKEVLDFYRSNDIDLFINVSKSEGIPVAIMEAMSFSIPVLATNVGGTSELVNEENGFLVDERIDFQALRVQIDKCLNLKLEEVNKMRQAAFETANVDYNAKRNFNCFVSEIAKI